MRRRGQKALLAGAAVLCLGAFLSACGKPEETPPVPPSNVQHYKQDGIYLSMHWEDKHMTTAETLEVRLVTRSAEDVEVTFPGEAADFGKFTLLKRETPPPELIEDSRLQSSRMYVLEPFLPGDYTLPSLEVRFQGPEDDAPKTIRTDPVDIQVTSVLPEGEEAELRDIAAPATVPPPAWPWIVGMIAALLLGAAALAYWRWRAAQPKPVPPPEPADDRALRRLAELRRSGMVERGEIEAFYVAVSDVVRRYLEEGHGMHAPERTTEEFLAELEQSRALEGPLQQNLRDFLRHCDLVKFAAYEPQRSEIDASVDSAEKFIRAMAAAKRTLESDAGAKEGGHAV